MTGPDKYEPRRIDKLRCPLPYSRSGFQEVQLQNCQLDGHVALVTGSAGGLGRAMAHGLLKAGAKVVFTDRAAPRSVIGEPEMESSENAAFVTADVANSTDLQRLVVLAQAEFGAIDILINNAGIGPGSIRPNFYDDPIRFWEIDETKMRRFFEINSVAPAVLSALVLPGMIQKGWGRIINVTTSLTSMTRSGRAGYGPSKAALEAHTAIMAGDLAGTGITANVLIPGAIADTAMVPTGSQFDRSALLSPERMAAPAVWLSSGEAQDVTGHRFLASAWDPSLPGSIAAGKSGALITFGASDQQPIRPVGFIDRGLKS
jgi:NAD(P)-dependent dehydrogenase (short-subunit alcohol dehydrogenase family)